MNKKQENIFIISNIDNKELILEISSYIKKNERFNVHHFICEKNFSHEMIDIYKKNIYKKDNARLIVVDDYGVLPFMVLGKIKGSVVAVLEDEYSAKLTKEHNNSNVIVLASMIIGSGLLFAIIDAFLCFDFENGRHEKRIKMLDELLEKEII